MWYCSRSRAWSECTMSHITTSIAYAVLMHDTTLFLMFPLALQGGLVHWNTLS